MTLPPLQDSSKILNLISEIYGSILAPERFVEVLELWDASVSSSDDLNEFALEILDKQLSHVVPLLETTMRDVTNKDEIVSRIIEAGRPSLLISPTRIIVGSNAEGRELFGLRDGDRVHEEFLGSEHEIQFADMLKLAAGEQKEDGFQVISTMLQSNGHSPNGLLMAMRVIRTSAEEQGFVLISSMEFMLSDQSKSAIKSAFSLTAGEMRVVESLANGMRQIDIAAQLGVREDTIKKHIKTVREKTNTPNSTALICLIASFSQISTEHSRLATNNLPSQISTTNASNQTYVMPTQHRIAKVNGLRLEYTDHGSPQGYPVLIMHSSMIGFILPANFIAQMTKAGFRLIIPFRPGYGISDPMPEPFDVLETARHLIEFTKVLGLKHYSIIGGTTGLIYGFAMHHLKAKHIDCVMGIAGYLPIDPKKLRAGMAPYHRAIVYTVSKKRSLAKFLVLSGYKLYLLRGPRVFLAQLAKGSPSDKRVVDDQTVLSELSFGLRIAGAQGVDALLNDSTLVLMDWKHMIADLTVPVKLFHGADDAVFPYELVKDFVALNPAFNLEVLEDVGQLMLYDKPVQVASKLSQFMKSFSTFRPKDTP